MTNAAPRSRTTYKTASVFMAAAALHLLADRTAFLQGAGHQVALSRVALQARGGHLPGEKAHSHGHNDVDEDSHIVGAGVTPLMNAAHEGDFEKVAALTLKGANLDTQDAYGWTALRYAVRNGHHEVASMLLHTGANVDLASKTGRTPLMSAACNKLFVMCDLLVDSGADLMAKDESGQTAFDLCRRGGPTGSKRIRDLVAGGQTMGAERPKA
mmetsp:Transcript_35125/g.93111  ORF Transcript_35125/g.93111 Transcript_35125/m.93111 type:complete len:213 (-) Transcript_35125:274-912(-)